MNHIGKKVGLLMDVLVCTTKDR